MKLLFFGLVFFIFSCGNKTGVTQIKDSQNICKYSKWLRISETKDLVSIEIINPDEPSQIIRLKLPNFNSNRNEDLAYDMDDPVQRLAVFSSTHIGMLGELNLMDHIVAVSNLNYVYSPVLKNQKPIEVGEAQVGSAERVISSKAQVIVYNGFSNQFPKQKLLKKIGILTIPNFDWREVHPLGRAEWLLLFGYLTGHADEAKTKFQEICGNYNKLKSEINRGEGLKTLSGNIWNDEWNAPAGQSYHATILNDAGLDYIFSNQPGSGSLTYSFEQVLGMGSDIDLWLNPGFPTKEAILRSHPKSKLLPALNLSSVFCYTHNANKYWEQSATRPDLVLADYAELNKGSKMNEKKLIFYKRIE